MKTPIRDSRISSLLFTRGFWVVGDSQSWSFAGVLSWLRCCRRIVTAGVSRRFSSLMPGSRFIVVTDSPLPVMRISINDLLWT
ncbi:hypothetical protein BVRB_7g178710 [Beta vulgaris subsp. vulgaris]|uniref:Uncharacterized protein n=1 Tax=Beta vulgaris subsp. vulgaris TaxID=3555 RepID=A0A0J8B775_BETVV|nr:hypothetical protein BVRB_7g178710 [Beta vulgaris subsp. vulgaris]